MGRLAMVLPGVLLAALGCGPQSDGPAAASAPDPLGLNVAVQGDNLHRITAAIPPGTPFGKAEATLARAGFRCTHRISERGGPDGVEEVASTLTCSRVDTGPQSPKWEVVLKGPETVLDVTLSLEFEGK